MENKVNYVEEGTFGNIKNLMDEIFGEVEHIDLDKISINEIEKISKSNEEIALQLIQLIIEILNNKKIPYDIKNFIYNRLERISEESEKIIKGA